ncbi:MAG: ABC transporter ATP-binding protein [Cetobacterium somerae]|jgi:lipoprotein-releasing system ATP-binding protein|uniref:Putative lipoprotein releasing system, ATP-binding protein n=1 Tax=Cetobacterium somerae ATCC BAA-474 TaxID=1319815 RepID=U7VEU7_9FUSO|nr:MULTISPECIES: ABC transporter ATP-binding protein [Cetobacterium]ERT70041.1 putative lipoprotein releasing system, ATP-binding protein [Cetobacterium somerae ATCC BAA-474]MBC2853758.1 ABC transporter ATP-binding protein [Cetobacterium sp. 2G large]MCQ9626670.1 ABC transporter ATP-binding protein [Cetobacterium somerae]WVJ02081.1 ABC transporter ATP-binding protein [Cetobacterium somerae]
MTKNIVLELKNICKNYSTKTETLEIIKNLNLQIEEGDFISILGQSGSGKTTLLNLIGLLDSPTSGNIYIDNENISVNSSNIDLVRNKKIGFVFQFHYLLPEFTALENVMIPALTQDYSKKKEIEKRALELLKEVGVDHRANHKPTELSGGEKQRVAIARALINNPKILLLDEPTGNLDNETSEKIFNIFKQINSKKRQTIITVTHSRELAEISNKKLFLKKGILSE